jgi:DNA-binding transcriptional ArsR family regulator
MLDLIPLVSKYLPFVVAYPHRQMDALGDPTRRAILERLLEGPVAVGELARDFPISRPAISQHLRVLKHASLVIDRPLGTRRLYELNPAGVEALRAYFDRFWNHALAAFKRAAEKEETVGKSSRER